MKRLIKKIIAYFFSDSSKAPATIPGCKLLVGPNCSIDPTALLNGTETSEIILEGDNYIGRNVEIGPLTKISLGNNTSLQDRCILLGDIEIGKSCLFAPNVFISSGRHYFDLHPEMYIKDQDELVQNSAELKARHSRKISIEDDCWIGVNAVIMPGVTIAKGSVIGANSVVTKNVEPYTIVAGIPATEVKKRLQFKAKHTLDALKDADLPYFYSGFYCSSKHLTVSRKKGGVQSSSYFKLFLEYTNFQKITLHLVNPTSDSLTLNYHGQTQHIAPLSDSKCIFDIENTYLHEFKFGATNAAKAKIDSLGLIVKLVEAT